VIVGGGINGAAIVTMLQLLVALPAATSDTLAANVVVPAPVGVPITVPVKAFRTSPAGSAPVTENA